MPNVSRPSPFFYCLSLSTFPLCSDSGKGTGWRVLFRLNAGLDVVLVVASTLYMSYDHSSICELRPRRCMLVATSTLYVSSAFCVSCDLDALSELRSQRYMWLPASTLYVSCGRDAFWELSLLVLYSVPRASSPATPAPTAKTLFCLIGSLFD